MKAGFMGQPPADALAQEVDPRRRRTRWLKPHHVRAIALSADTLLVGAENDASNGKQSGAAFVFVHGAEGWQLEAKLTMLI